MQKSIVRGLAAAIAAAVVVLTAARSQAVLLYATSGNDIARFDSGATGVVTSVPVTGLQAGESLVGIDVRPANQVVYGIGSSSRIYTINPLTGAGNTPALRLYAAAGFREDRRWTTGDGVPMVTLCRGAPAGRADG